MKTILIATDDRPETDKALEAAAFIAQKIGRKIQLFPAVEATRHNSLSQPAIRVPIQFSDQTLVMEITEASIQNNQPEVPAQYKHLGQIEIQGENKNLVEATISKEIDLLVVGAKLINGRHEITVDFPDEGIKGATQIEEIILDSHVEGTKGASAAHEIPFDPLVKKALRFARCPVLTVINNDGLSNLKHVVLVTNFEQGSFLLFNKVKEFQQILDFKLYLLHVNALLHQEPSTAMEDKMNKLAKQFSFKNFTSTVIDAYTYEDGIIEFSKSIYADMIALPIDKHQDISKLLEENLNAGVNHYQVKYFLTYNIQ